MDVPRHAGAGGFADVHPQVHAIGTISFFQAHHRLAHQQHHLEQRFFAGQLRRRDMLVGRNQHVPARVWKGVQHDEIALGAVDDKILLVLPLRGLVAKNAAGRFLRGRDVFITPGGPQTIHQTVFGGSPVAVAGTLCGAAAAPAPFAAAVFTRAFSSLLGLKYGMRLGGTSTRVPVLGLRPTRGWRWRVRKLPNPRISILSPARNERTMLSKMASTMTSDSFRVISTTRETSSIRSALVIWYSPCPLKPLPQYLLNGRFLQAIPRCDF